jgi:hypothetical protein
MSKTIRSQFRVRHLNRLSRLDAGCSSVTPAHGNTINVEVPESHGHYP